MEWTSYKNEYGFRLAAPSYIFPADYIYNARQLAPYLDEVELLFFESSPTSLPGPAEIEQLRGLKETLNLEYNVHLPLDLNLCEENEEERERAILSLEGVLALVRPLAPTTCTLHLPMKIPHAQDGSPSIKAWQDLAVMGVDRLLARAALPPRMISVETLDYPPTWFGPIVEQLDLSVCVDVGHVIRYGFHLPSVLDQYGPRITICHLHGAVIGKDHLALQQMETGHLRTVRHFLSSFTQTVSLEVFSARRLNESMRTLAQLMRGVVPA